MVMISAAPDAIVDAGVNHGETINGPINEAINEAIKRSPGINKPKLIARVGKSKATVERAIAALVASSKIEHRGSKKTGGYYAL